HVIDAAEYVTGQRFDEVSATLHTFVTQRPLASTSVGLSAVGGDDTGEVTVDDAALVTGRMTGGALATIEATRFATGRKNAMRLEVNGSLGSIAFDFESMNELNFYDANDPGRDAGFRRIYVTEPDHPYAAAWWPPGHGLGYDHAFVNELGDFLTDLAEGRRPQPSFEDGLHLQRVLDASERSSDNGSAWTPVENGKKRNGSRPR
ncbi:MAG: gfo/Idh/MocA family oxidoreductase, partial [Microbacterium sp.]|nr:gfo/Idh/MocA family oxidoreductase [Microbacterium sp.]